MTLRQSSKTGTLLVTKPVAAGLAGFLASTTEDTSSWSTVSGVKQQSGWAVCDGSTLDNSSGKYDDFLARTGSLTLPNGPYRTKQVDNSVLSIFITGATLDSVSQAVAIAYSDSEGAWRLRVNIVGSLTSADASFDINITGITFKNIPGGSSQAASGSDFNTNVATYAIANSNRIFYKNNSAQTEFSTSGDFRLESKPTWADANLEATPLIQLVDNVGNAVGVPEATADQAGTVSTGDQVWSGNKEFQGEIKASSIATDSGTLELNQTPKTLFTLPTESGMYMVYVSWFSGSTTSRHAVYFINTNSTSVRALVSIAASGITLSNSGFDIQAVCASGSTTIKWSYTRSYK